MVPVTIMNVQIFPKLWKLAKLPELRAAGEEKAGRGMCGADGLTMTLPVR
jgi:hypothetical protein